MNKLSPFLVFLALVIAPLSVSAMEFREEKSQESSAGHDTRLNSKILELQAAKDSGGRHTRAQDLDDDDSPRAEITSTDLFQDAAIDSNDGVAPYDIPTEAARSSSPSFYTESLGSGTSYPLLPLVSLTTGRGEADQRNFFSSRVIQKQSASLRHGGLSNNRADCFINSSLQLCKAFADQLDRRELERMPMFAQFLSEGLSTDEECRVLRSEMATEVIKDHEDLHGVIQQGVADTHQDAVAFLRLLLAETKAPQLFLEETFTNLTTGEIRTTDIASREILQLSLPEDTGVSVAMQDLVNAALLSRHDQRWIDEDITSQLIEVQSVIRLKNDSVSPTLVIALGRYASPGVKNQIFVEGFKNKITLPLVNGEQVCYEPTAIICHRGASLEEGHYICYRKENGVWLLFNDNEDVEFPVALEGNFAPKNCCVIAYKRLNVLEDSNEHFSSEQVTTKEPQKKVIRHDVLPPSSNVRKKASLELTARAMRVFLDYSIGHSLKEAKKCLTKLQLDAVVRDQVSERMLELISSAARLVEYLNHFYNKDGRELIGLDQIRIDRQEEILRLRVNLEESKKFRKTLSYDDYNEPTRLEILNDRLSRELDCSAKAAIADAKGEHQAAHLWTLAAAEAASKAQDWNRSIPYHLWDHNNVAYYRAKVEEARIAKDQEKIDFWTQAVMQAQIASVNKLDAERAEERATEEYVKKEFSYKNDSKNFHHGIAPTSSPYCYIEPQDSASVAFRTANSFLQSARSIDKSEAQAIKTQQAGVETWVDCWGQENNIVTYTTKAGEAQAAGNTLLADLWTQAAQEAQLASKYSLQKTHPDAIDNPTKAQRLDSMSKLPKNRAKRLAQIAYCTDKAIQAQGNDELADFWLQAAGQFKSAADYKLQERSEDNEFEAVSAAQRNAALAAMEAQRFIQSAQQAMILAQYTANALEAQRKGKQDLADLWMQTRDYFKVAAERKDSRFQESIYGIRRLGNRDEDNCIENIVRHTQEALDTFIQATEALRVGNKPLSDLWAQAANQLQIQADYELQLVQATIARRDYSEIRVLKKRSAIAQHAAERFLQAAQAMIENTTYLSQLKKAQLEDNHKVADLWAKAAKHSDVIIKETVKLAHLWTQSSLEDEDATKKSRVFLEKTISSTRAAARSFNWYAHAVMQRLAQAVTCRSKAIAASIKKNYELARFWEQTAQAAEKFVHECNVHTVELLLARPNDIVFSRDEIQKKISLAEDPLDSSAFITDSLARAAYYKTRAATGSVAQNTGATDFWTQAANQSEAAAEYCAKAVEAIKTENKKEAMLWAQASKEIDIAIQNTVYAAQALEAEHQEHVKRWKSIGIRSQIAAERFANAALAQGEGKQKLADLWTEAGKSVHAALDKEEPNYYLSYYIPQHGNSKRYGWTIKPQDQRIDAAQKATNLNTLISRSWLQAAEALMRGEEESSDLLEEIAKLGVHSRDKGRSRVCQDAIERFTKAHEALEKGDKALATRWSLLGKKTQAIIEYQPTEKVRTPRNTDRHTQKWNEIERSAEDACNKLASQMIDCLAKALELELQEKPTVMVLWNKAAAQFQAAFEHKTQEAKAANERKKTDVDRYRNLAKKSESIADKLVETAEVAIKSPPFLVITSTEDSLVEDMSQAIVTRTPEHKEETFSSTELGMSPLAQATESKDNELQVTPVTSEMDSLSTLKAHYSAQASMLEELRPPGPGYKTWKQAVAHIDAALKYQNKAAQAHDKGNDKKAEHLTTAAHDARTAAELTAQAAEKKREAAHATASGENQVGQRYSAEADKALKRARKLAASAIQKAKR